jgi:hypothetical protein
MVRKSVLVVPVIVAIIPPDRCSPLSSELHVKSLDLCSTSEFLQVFQVQHQEGRLAGVKEDVQ